MNTEYIGLGFWCLTQLSISTIFQLCRGSQFYCWRIIVYPEKQPTCRKSLTNFYQNIYHGSINLCLVIYDKVKHSNLRNSIYWENQISDGQMSTNGIYDNK